jgi:hypothetical protein
MWKHIAAVCTAVVLAAAAGNGGTAAATPTAPTEHRPVTVHAAISPATGHHARAGTCTAGECTLMAVPDPAPATLDAAVAPRTDTPTVSRGDCPARSTGAGYRIDTPRVAPLLALGLDNGSTHAGLRTTAPDRAPAASGCAG